MPQTIRGRHYYKIKFVLKIIIGVNIHRIAGFSNPKDFYNITRPLSVKTLKQRKISNK